MLNTLLEYLSKIRAIGAGLDDVVFAGGGVAEASGAV
jgi:hypothetical protein